MRKKLYGIKEILDEFLYICYTKNIPLYKTRDIIYNIIKDDYSLYQIDKRLWDHQKRTRIFMCEWIESGTRDSDEWILSPDRFISGLAREYYRDLERDLVA